MDNATPVEWLTAAISQATKAASFCVAGCLPPIDPEIDVEGLGAIGMPLKRGMAKKLVAMCQPAPYGKGEQTLVDTKVRKTFELDPAKFDLGDEWNEALADALPAIANQLGLPADRLEARLYKLLVYEKGGFFLRHRDSEKHDRMVASLIIVLPNPFEGGALIVRHGTAKQTLTFDKAVGGAAPCYAAFYADCEHEVQRVTAGVRMCLTYNLVLNPPPMQARGRARSAASTDVLAESNLSWLTRHPAQPLVFALDHHYTQRGLSLDLLKGGDRQAADLVVAAAEASDCVVHLAQVSRHLSQFADDGSFGRSYSRRDDPPHALDIGETYEDELLGTQWTDVRGKAQPWGDIAFDPPSIVSSAPMDQWKPTSEEFEGYTGNAGNTLDRWYHRSALVVWRRDDHFDVVARGGVAHCIPLFCSLAAKLSRTPKSRLDEARGDCIRFAQAIIAKWPRDTFRSWRPSADVTAPYSDFATHLLLLQDRDTVALFLTRVADDPYMKLGSFVVAASREFGWSAFAGELKNLLAARPTGGERPEIPLRDIEWLFGFCRGATKDPDRLAVARDLCAVAVEQFCKPAPKRAAHERRHHYREPSVSETSLPLLLKALAVSGRDEDLARVIRFVQDSPAEFNRDECQVPCLKSLAPWWKKEFGEVHPHMLAWLAAVRQQLEAATAATPRPYTDWARPAEVACKCVYCAQLKSFLTDPLNEVGRIRAPEAARSHIMTEIGGNQCDVTATLERRGSPHSLVLTKTADSFERAVKHYEANLKLLSDLPDVD